MPQHLPCGETVTPPLDRSLAWLDEGTRLVERAVADADLATASGLPGAAS